MCLNRFKHIEKIFNSNILSQNSFSISLYLIILIWLSYYFCLLLHFSQEMQWMRVKIVLVHLGKNKLYFCLFTLPWIWWNGKFNINMWNEERSAYMQSYLLLYLWSGKGTKNVAWEQWKLLLLFIKSFFKSVGVGFESPVEARMSV